MAWTARAKKVKYKQNVPPLERILKRDAGNKVIIIYNKTFLDTLSTFHGPIGLCLMK